MMCRVRAGIIELKDANHSNLGFCSFQNNSSLKDLLNKYSI